MLTFYRTKYAIRYTVEGRTYRSILRSNGASSNQKSAQSKLLNNPVGTRRKVYYVPSNPENFVGDPLAHVLGFCMIFVTVGVAVLACGALLHFRLSLSIGSKWLGSENMNGPRIASWIVGGVGLIILAKGLLVLRSRVAEIQRWTHVEATVSRAWVSEHRGAESTSYLANYELPMRPPAAL